MKVAIDISRTELFRHGEYYYPGLATLLSILGSGGEIVLFSSNGGATDHEIKLINRLAQAFAGLVYYSSSKTGDGKACN